MNQTISAVVDTFALPDREYWEDLGLTVGKLYTDMGLPVDIALGQLKEANQTQKVAVLNSACSWLIQHKRNSGATEKSLERQRKTNAKMIQDFITKGETGVY